MQLKTKSVEDGPWAVATKATTTLEQKKKMCWTSMLTYFVRFV